MLGQRRRRWPNIEPPLSHSLDPFGRYRIISSIHNNRQRGIVTDFQGFSPKF